MQSRTFPKPVLYVSKCLGFDSCRFNGQILGDEFVDMLLQHARIAIVCPEVEIGLGVPRNPIRLVQDKQSGKQSLLQYETERDVTSEMLAYNKSFINAVGPVDGFILKSRSPSCGFSGVKVYPSLGKVSSLGSSAGIFAGAVAEAFPHAACEDEGRLTNFRIREHFLTRIFATAHFREISQTPTIGALVSFHSQYKYLLMGYDQEQMRELGRITANHDGLDANTVFAHYFETFVSILAKLPERPAMINALHHVFGHISDACSAQEKQFILNSIEMYREERVPLSVPLHLLFSHALRNDDEYIGAQILFQPFPLELVLISDSGRGRKL